MEKKQKFDSVKKRTLECLRQVVLVDENRRNEIDAWLDEAIDNGDLELYFMEREGRQVEDLSSVARQLYAGIDAETIKENLTSGLFGLGNIQVGEGVISIGEGDGQDASDGADEQEGTKSKTSKKKEDSMTLRGVSHNTRHWRTMIDYDYESEFGDRATFRISVSRWSISEQKRQAKIAKRNEQVAKIVQSAESKDKAKKKQTENTL